MVREENLKDVTHPSVAPTPRRPETRVTHPPPTVPHRPPRPTPDRCPATRSWRNSAAAAWASSTRPGTSAQPRGGPQDDPGRRPCRGRSRGALPPRPRPSPGCSTPTSCRSTRSASTTASRFLPGILRRRQPGRRLKAARRCRPRGRGPGRDAGPGDARRPRARHHPPRPEAGQRAAGARDDVHARPAAGPWKATSRSPTSAWPSSIDDRQRPDAEPGPSWARRRTWPPSRRQGASARSARRRTCTPWGDPLRIADGPAAVPWGVGLDTIEKSSTRSRSRRRGCEREIAVRPGNDLPEVSAQRAGATPVPRRWRRTCAVTWRASRSVPAVLADWSGRRCGCGAGRAVAALLLVLFLVVDVAVRLVTWKWRQEASAHAYAEIQRGRAEETPAAPRRRADRAEAGPVPERRCRRRARVSRRQRRSCPAPSSKRVGPTCGTGNGTTCACPL